MGLVLAASPDVDFLPGGIERLTAALEYDDGAAFAWGMLAGGSVGGGIEGPVLWRSSALEALGVAVGPFGPRHDPGIFRRATAQGLRGAHVPEIVAVGLPRSKTTLHELPLPPFDLANRVGGIQAAEEPWATYDSIGRSIRRDLLEALPDDYSLEGRRILDFGCGAGRLLRHFVHAGPSAEWWGCDIDAESIDWLRLHLSPPLHVFRNDELPPLPLDDRAFDVVLAVSVFTHLTRSWSAWLAELHRVLEPNGLLLATFMGEGWCRRIIGEEWDEESIGMLTLLPGEDWSRGGPMVLHSPWWLREHWGRMFDVVSIRPYGFPRLPRGEGQGIAVLRKKEVQLSPGDLEAPSDDPREAAALAHNVSRLLGELEELRPAWRRLTDDRESLSEG